MKQLLLIALALPLCAQSVASCKLALGSSGQMRDIYGGKTGVIQGMVRCINDSTSNVTVSGNIIDISLGTIDTVPGPDAKAMLTKTFNGQTGQRLTRDFNTGLGVLGAFLASAILHIAQGPTGWIILGTQITTQYIIPSFTANEAALDFSSQCDDIHGVTLAPLQELSCRIYVKKPLKTDPQIPAAFNFHIGGAFPTPGPLPPSPPLELKPPTPRGASLEQSKCPDGQIPWGDRCLDIVLKSDGPVTPVPVVSIDTDRVNRIMQAHEAGYIAQEVASMALPADPCAWDSCTAWEKTALL